MDNTKANRTPVPVASTPVCAERSAPMIRDAVVQAAIQAGDGDLVAYLRRQAGKHPNAFLTLLGNV